MEISVKVSLDKKSREAVEGLADAIRQSSGTTPAPEVVETPTAPVETQPTITPEPAAPAEPETPAPAAETQPAAPVEPETPATTVAPPVISMEELREQARAFLKVKEPRGREELEKALAAVGATALANVATEKYDELHQILVTGSVTDTPQPSAAELL